VTYSSKLWRTERVPGGYVCYNTDSQCRNRPTPILRPMQNCYVM